MLQQRFEYNPSKHFTFLKVPLNTTTFNCSIEISDTAKWGEVDISPSSSSPQVINVEENEFPCRCLKSDPSKFVVTLVGIENSTCLRSVKDDECFRFRYRLSSTTTATSDADEEQILIPLNNTVSFSYSYGTYKDFGIGIGNHDDVTLVYMFPLRSSNGGREEDKGFIVSSWISPSPWKIMWSVAPVKRLLTSIVDKTRNILMLTDDGDNVKEKDDGNSGHDS